MNIMSEAQQAQMINHLPVLSQVVLQAIAVIDSEDPNQAEVTAILANDPGLVTQLLGLANSPFYGLSGKVLSIEKACIMLGLHTIRSTLLAVSAMNTFPADGGKVYDWEFLWHHSLTVAGISKFLATQLRKDEGSAFTAGLLHDIGKMVFDECCADKLPEVINFQKEQDCYEFDAELAILGINHMTLGAKLALHWKLPKVVITAIAEHHNTTQQVEHTELAELVNLADLLCHGLQIEKQENILIPPLIENSLQKLGINWNQIKNWLPEIQPLIQ